MICRCAGSHGAEPSAPTPSPTGEGEDFHVRCGVGVPEPVSETPEDSVREAAPKRSHDASQESARSATRTDYFARYRDEDGSIDLRRWGQEHGENEIDYREDEGR